MKKYLCSQIFTYFKTNFVKVVKIHKFLAMLKLAKSEFLNYDLAKFDMTQEQLNKLPHESAVIE